MTGFEKEYRLFAIWHFIFACHRAKLVAVEKLVNSFCKRYENNALKILSLKQSNNKVFQTASEVHDYMTMHYYFVPIFSKCPILYQNFIFHYTQIYQSCNSSHHNRLLLIASMIRNRLSKNHITSYIPLSIKGEDVLVIIAAANHKKSSQCVVEHVTFIVTLPQTSYVEYIA